MDKFVLKSPFGPVEEQRKAIEYLVNGLQARVPAQVLLGVTGSGKTFTIANAIEAINRPALVISHNKTLAAQLYSELKEFFPHNAVEYFVSYYDYYQPEAYIPQTDVYIEKDSSINDRLDRLRLAATTSLMSRRDVIIVASVSCIYNLGSPEDYQNYMVQLKCGQRIERDHVLEQLIGIQYERNDYDFSRGKMRVRGDVVEVFPAYRQDALRIEFFDEEIEKIKQIDPITGNTISDLDRVAIYPAKHFLISPPRLEQALQEIQAELEGRLKELESQGKLLEAQRLKSRTRYDMEMMKEIGTCKGIENYSRVLSGRPPGSKPFCLIDYFPEDFITVIDESHVTVPQLGGMYEGDRSRKEMLVNHGFRLPSCLDNRPLKFHELKPMLKEIIYVSATPSPFEKKEANGRVTELIIRPTGIIDPPIILKPTQGQIDDLIDRVRGRAGRNERTLVTTLTKRMAEDLCDYLQGADIKVKYLHADIETIERAKILQDLRLQKFDCLIGVNLLREGLDLPEVSLVAIFDADKEGFLRSQTSLIQTAGRAARNINGEVVMYADSVSAAMRGMMAECERRRKIQIAYNQAHNITPQTIKRAITAGIDQWAEAEELVMEASGETDESLAFNHHLHSLEQQMEAAARNLEFEKAARIRDRLKELKAGTFPDNPKHPNRF